MNHYLYILSIALSFVFNLQAQEKLEQWKGDKTHVEVLKSGLFMDGMEYSASRWNIDASQTDIQLTKAFPAEINQGSLWLGCLVQRTAFSKKMGLALYAKGKQQLSFGTDGRKRLYINEQSTPADTRAPLFLLLRIDYSKEAGKDKAYLFINQSPSSVPDYEGASCVLEGEFSADALAIVADKGAEGELSNLYYGSSFKEAVRAASQTQLQKQGSILPVQSWKIEDNVLWISSTGGTLRLEALENNIFSIKYGTRKQIEASKSYAVVDRPSRMRMAVKETRDALTVTAGGNSIKVAKATGVLQYFNASGQLILSEKAIGARATAQEEAMDAFCNFDLTQDEALYGLGQFRDSVLNLRGKFRELVQFNTQAAVPVLYSTNGWGMFWDNPSRTLFSDNDKEMCLASDYGKIVDYYVFVGENMDSLIASYRTLTGAAPMQPSWTLGYHQSRNKYANQAELMGVAKRMKSEGIPMGSIFIDYYYWQKYGTGSHRFDETLWPNVKEMLDSLHHVYDTKAVITLWPTFNKETANFKELNDKGMILNSGALDGLIYDPFNPEAAEIYNRQVRPLIETGIDGWFLDGPEPDLVVPFLKTTTYAGPARTVRNLYPLVHVGNFKKGLMEARPGVRPYILTRCAWAAQQRLGTAIWSGDIPTTFAELNRQVVAGLSFVATGIPYWTSDIGGYSGGDPAQESYRELFTRWFQYGTFCPVFRAHGRRYPGDRKTPNELWAFGEKAQAICTDFVQLRYALFPYIYSLAGDVTHEDYTIMRHMAFDYPDQKDLRDCKDQFMFGPSFMVCPVLKAGAKSRLVKFPAGEQWYDYWTGELQQGGQEKTVQTSMETIPLYVKAGSVIPYYSQESKSISTEVPLEIRIYKGKDGHFTLYEDDGNTFDYEEGAYSHIRMHWDEAKQVFTIQDRQGSFKGMKKTRELSITCYGEGEKEAKQNVTYKGKALRISF